MESKHCSVMVILVTLLFPICTAFPSLDPKEEEARRFVEDASRKLYTYYDTMAANTLGLETQVWSQLFNAIDTLISKSDLMLDIVRNAMELSKTKYKDEELNYIFKKLKKSADVVIRWGTIF
ncbi:uncharacterized protein LOC129941986 [Eupeodes corollae]|uniref:uncharacterized protein LOC129941986 n=1 Tax=Eupeodes corollae TaxID=290404 RepID=UPI0024934482|nr:uncharacterized protein LOC129941986 [Eupeodes corollae]